MSISRRSSATDEPRHFFAPVLRPDLLCRIRELNSDYLELLASERDVDECMGQLQYLPPRLRSWFAEISVEQCARLAAAPYALYSLRFEDARFWQTACSTSQRRIDERYMARAGERSLHVLFVETALIQAWHIANTRPLAVRVLYSMREPVRERIAGMPLWQVKRIATEHPEIMTPRWPANPCFWPDLLTFAKTGDSMRLAATQLLGTQLIAAELVGPRLR